MFECLLLAIDDSPGSEVATVFASAFAQRSSASVHVLHVNEFVVGGRGVTLLTSDEARALLSRAVAQLRENGVPTSGSVCVASYRQVAKRIIETAREQVADAIVVGSHRHRGLDRLFSSKVRDRVTRLTALPVLVAPAPLGVSMLSVRDMEAELQRTLSHFPT